MSSYFPVWLDKADGTTVKIFSTPGSGFNVRMYPEFIAALEAEHGPLAAIRCDREDNTIWTRPVDLIPNPGVWMCIGPIGWEDVRTDDGRLLVFNTTIWREPVAVLSDRVAVGWLDKIWRNGNEIFASGHGTPPLDDADAVEVRTRVAINIGNVGIWQPQHSTNDFVTMPPEVDMKGGTIIAVTVTEHPAFEGAHLTWTRLT